MNKRVFLRVVLGAVGVAAVLGVMMIFVPSYGNLAGRLVWTAILLAVGSMACFLAAMVVEKGRHVWLAKAGMAGVVPAFLVCMGMIWFWDEILQWLAGGVPRENYAHYFRYEMMMRKVAVTACVPVVCLVVAALLLMPRLRMGARWVQMIAVGLMGVTAVVGLGVMWWEPHVEEPYQFFGVMLILSLAGIVGTPILGRFYGVKTDEELGELSRTITVVCPRCGVRQEMRMGEGRCCGCRLKFKIEVEEPRCGKCGYILHGLTRAVCPECGEGFDAGLLGTGTGGGGK